ncbi:MAG: hypothetical protein ACMXYG_01210 [Candidatus Woesearchaeota archaeon]
MTTFFMYNKDMFMILSLFIISVVSMLPLRVIPWFGFFDMNTLLTVYASMVYGLPAGLIVGTASVFGIINSGDVDNNIFFDLCASYIVAIVASFFLISAYVPIVTVLALTYATLSLTFHKLFGTLDFLNVTWTITNFIWVIFVLYKILPLLGLA